MINAYEVTSEQSLMSLFQIFGRGKFPITETSFTRSDGSYFYEGMTVYIYDKKDLTGCTHSSGTFQQVANYVNRIILETEWNANAFSRMDIKQQIEAAVSVVGKYLPAFEGDDICKITGYEFLTSKGTKTWTNSEHIDYSLEKYGVFVNLNGTFLKTSRTAFRAVVSAPLVTVNPCIINNHLGVDKGTYYEFGCAKIDKVLLKAAHVFLSAKARSNITNRAAEYVVIGNGKFTLEDIKKLNIDDTTELNV